MSGWHREEDGRLVRLHEHRSPERGSPEPGSPELPSSEVHSSRRSASSEARRSRRHAQHAAARASSGFASPEVDVALAPAVPASLEVVCGKRELALVAVDSSPQSVVHLRRRRRRASGSSSEGPEEDLAMEAELMENLREVEVLRLAVAQQIAMNQQNYQIPGEHVSDEVLLHIGAPAPFEDHSFDVSTLQNDSSEMHGDSSPQTPRRLPEPTPGWMSRPSPSGPPGLPRLANSESSVPRTLFVGEIPSGIVSGFPAPASQGTVHGDKGPLFRECVNPPGSSSELPSSSTQGPVNAQLLRESLDSSPLGTVVHVPQDIVDLQNKFSAMEQFLTGKVLLSPDELQAYIGL